MMEIRYNPVVGEWVMISSDRQTRPVQPTEAGCPLCPGGAEFDRDYDLAVFDNRFPALKERPPEVISSGEEIFTNMRSFGRCEVVMFTSEHDSSLSRMPVGQIEKLIYVLEDRTRELMTDRRIRFIFPFENRGKEVGATLSHPHGQIYAFPFLPKRISNMVEAQRRYFEKKGKSVISDIVKAELRIKERIVYETEYFLAVIPYFAHFPYEVHIYPKRLLNLITEMTAEEKFFLAVMLKVVTSKYDALFEMEFPYMMAIFQAPVNPVEKYFNFHIEFYPPKRDKDKIKWMASVETGTWTFINPTTPSESAKRLRGVPFSI